MDSLVTDELWDSMAPFLPEHAPSAKGGRPRVADRDCLRGILFVLREGIRWQSLPREMGAGSGSTCWRSFHQWSAAGVFGKVDHPYPLAADNQSMRISEVGWVAAGELRLYRDALFVGMETGGARQSTTGNSIAIVVLLARSSAR